MTPTQEQAITPDQLTPEQYMVVYPDGRREVHPWPDDENARLPLMKAHVEGDIEYVPPSAHTLQTHEVVVNEEGMVDDLPPNWPGSRLIGYDLRRQPPLHGTVLIVPHNPQDPPLAAQRRNARAHDHVFALALAGDKEALAALGLQSPDQIAVIDTRPEPRVYLYLIHPDGRTERYEPNDRAASRAWVEERLGHAYRMHPSAHMVRAYAGLYAAQPKDPTPNVPASIGLGVWGMRHALGPVVLMPTGQPDETLLHDRLHRALNGDPEAQQETGLTPTW